MQITGCLWCHHCHHCHRHCHVVRPVVPPVPCAKESRAASSDCHGRGWSHRRRSTWSTWSTSCAIAALEIFNKFGQKLRKKKHEKKTERNWENLWETPRVGHTDTEKLRDILRKTFGTLFRYLSFMTLCQDVTFPWCYLQLFSYAFVVFVRRRCQSLFVQWLCRQSLACLWLRSETCNFERFPAATQKRVKRLQYVVVYRHL